MIVSRYFAEAKDPSDKSWWKVQFRETLASVAPAVTPAFSSERWLIGNEDCETLTPDPNPELIEVSSVQLSSDLTAVMLWIEGGTHGQNYEIPLSVLLPDGSTILRRRILSVYRR